MFYQGLSSGYFPFFVSSLFPAIKPRDMMTIAHLHFVATSRESTE